MPLLLLPSGVYAGTYTWQTTDANGRVTAQSPTYTGGQVAFSGGPAPDQTNNYSLLYDGYGNAAEYGLATDINCSGAITATFTWQPDSTKTLATDPPPDQVIVQETSSASTGAKGPVAAPPTGECSNGLGVNPPFTLTPDGQGYVNGGARCTSTRYTPYAGGLTVMLPSCSPVAHSANTSNASKVRYSAVLYPVTVNLNGQNPNNQALTGQQITARLSTPNGLPSGTKITSYTWSFDSGVVAKPANPIKNWDGTASGDNTHPQLVPLTAADLTGTDTGGNGISVNSLSFYDQQAEGLSVKCAVSLKFLDGTTVTVNAKSVPVAFLKPTASWTFTQLTVADDPANGSFQAGELLGPISITVPSPFSGGNGCLVQLVTTDRSVKRHPLNGKPDTYYYKVQKTNPDGTTSWVVPGQGLDGGFPYTQSITLDANNQPVVTNNSGGYIWGANDPGTPADTPTQSCTNTSLPTDNGGNDWYQSHASDSFVDYLMYKPPPFDTQGVIWVPLKTLTWSWNAKATKDATGKWKSVGGMTTGQVTDATSPPQWSTVLQANEQYYP